MKTCTKCGSSGPFYRDSRIKSGLTSYCQKCINEANRQRYYRRRTDYMAKVMEWQRANPEKVRQYKQKSSIGHEDRGRIWYWANPEKSRERSRQWAKDNPEQHLAHCHARRARQLKAGGSYTAQEWRELCRQHDNRCVMCGEQKKLTADHIVPIVKGGSSNIDNIQPLCKSCNSKKATRTIDHRTVHVIRPVQLRLF
jgi:5-methylcytosine-specific restriction endonuclease McrA